MLGLARVTKPPPASAFMTDLQEIGGGQRTYLVQDVVRKPRPEKRITPRTRCSFWNLGQSDDISAKYELIPFSELVNTEVFFSRRKQLCAKKRNLAKKVAAARNLTNQQITMLELNMQAMIRKTSGKSPNIYRSLADAGPTTTVSCLKVAGKH